MSYAHVNYVRDHSKTRGAARLLLLVIATRTDKDGIAHPGYRCLAHDTGMSVRSVRRALDEIPKDEMEIKPGNSLPGQPRTSSRYKILLGYQDDCAPDAHSTVRVARTVNGNSDCAPGVPDCARSAHLTVRTVKEQKKSAAAPSAPGWRKARNANGNSPVKPVSRMVRLPN